MEWLFMIMWPHFLPKKVHDEVKGIIEDYFRDLSDTDQRDDDGC